MNFLKGAVLWNEATYSARKDSLAGGMAILLNNKVADNVHEHGVILQGRAQFVTFKLNAKEKLGILNIYGLNMTSPRASLWQKIAEFPLPGARWIQGCHT
jgi:hypothetical protein